MAEPESKADRGPPAGSGPAVFEIVGVLCFFGGLVGLAAGALAGRWAPFMDFPHIPGAPFVPVAVVTALGVVFLVLAARVRAGKLWAAICLTLLSWALLLVATGHLLVYGSGWLEGLFTVALVVAGHGCWARVGRMARTET